MHEPVMVSEVVHHLQGKKDGVIVDCTIGSGGHAKKLLEEYNGQCTLIGLDQDNEALERSRENLKAFKDHIHLRQCNFALLDTVCDELRITRVDAFLFDLGVSKNQLTDPERGFSFLHDGPLDMRMDRRGGRTAADIVNNASEGELHRIIQEYGEDRNARRYARAIVRARDEQTLSTTRELAEVIQRQYRGRRFSKIHPATRTFQALRIAVNCELEGLGHALQKVIHYLACDGVVCVISFHSLEDRIVKYTFRDWAQKGLVKLVTKKPMRPRKEEIIQNVHARSAKMRIAKRSLHE